MRTENSCYFRTFVVFLFARSVSVVNVFAGKEARNAIFLLQEGRKTDTAEQRDKVQTKGKER